MKRANAILPVLITAVFLSVFPCRAADNNNNNFPPQLQKMIQAGQVTPEQARQAMQAVRSGQVSPEVVRQAVDKAEQGTLTPAEIEAGKKMLEERQATIEEPRPKTEPVVDKTAAVDKAVQEGAKGFSEQAGLLQRVFGENLPALKLFGHELFAGGSAVFEPIRDMPVSKNYIIGPGDVVKVEMWGRLEASYALEVDNEGVINLPKIGPLTVVGLTFEELGELIKRKTEAITGVNVNVSMGKLRTMQIFVLGEIKSPGVHTVSSLATVVNALLASGGPTPLGSLRNVQLKRQGQLVTTIDLYDFLLKGDISADSRLMPADVIFVPPVGPLVAVSGTVNRPAVYEFKDQKTLQDAIALAGGLGPRAYNQRIQIERAAANRSEIIVDITYEQLRQQQPIAIQSGDIVKVSAIMPAAVNAVNLYGNVLRPGPYAYEEGLRLLDLIPGIDTLKIDTYFDYALIKRYHLADMSTELIPFDLGRLLSTRADSLNVALQPGDEIHIFSKWTFKDKPGAAIAGEVRSPGRYVVYEMKILDLIKQAGGLTDEAHLNKGELIRTDDDQMQHTIYFNVGLAIAGDPDHNISVQDKDQVVIHSVWEEQWQEAVAIEGEVKDPGNYVLTTGMRVKDLIFKAGNFTRDAWLGPGHIYRVDLRTKEVTIFTFNVEKAFAEDPEHNLLLKDQDKVVVHSIWEKVARHNVTAQGFVNNPGEYPYASNMTVRDLLLVAGGVKESAYLETAEIVRFDIVDGERMQTSLLNFNIERALQNDPAHNLKLQPWDILNIKQIPEWGESTEVTVSGEVLFPGTYSIRKEERLQSLIERAGGYTDMAYFRGAVFTRESVRALQQKRLNELVSRLSRELTTLATSEMAGSTDKEEMAGEQQLLAAQQRVVDRLSEVEASGRVVIKLAPGPGFRDSNFNLILQKGDSVYIPPRPHTVSVVGEVYNQTALIYNEDDSSLKYYLQQSGGPTRYANPKQMYILRADGSVLSRELAGRSVGWLSGFEDTTLYPGDTLVIPPKLIHTRLQRDIKDITSIIYELAVSAGIVITQVFD